MNNFNNDFEYGREYENKFLNFLQANNIVSKLNETEETDYYKKMFILSQYDIITNNNIKIEVKSDRRSDALGSLFVEIIKKRIRGAKEWTFKSGLSLTTSDYYAFYSPNKSEPYIIDTKILKQILKNNKYYEVTHITEKGDTIKYGGIILPVATLLRHTIAPGEFITRLKGV